MHPTGGEPSNFSYRQFDEEDLEVRFGGWHPGHEAICFRQIVQVMTKEGPTSTVTAAFCRVLHTAVKI